MPNWIKKVEKHCGDELHPGEEVMAAVFLQPVGAVRKAATAGALGAVGGAIGRAAVNASGAGAEGSGSATGAASGVPDGPTVMAVTGDRVLFFGFSHMRSRPTELLVELPRTSVVAAHVEKGKMAHGASFVFADGSSREYDLPRAQSYEAMVGLFD